MRSAGCARRGKRRYDEQVQSASARIVQLTHSHEARLENEVRQAAAQANVVTERLQASEAQAQLRLQEQAQLSNMLIAELRKALKETSDQATANTRTAAELEVALCKEILEAHHRLVELEPAWDMFIAKHYNEEEEAREQEQSRKAAVAAQPSEHRNRRLEDALDRSDPRLLAINPPLGAAADTTHLATPRGADNVLSGAPVPGSTSSLGMFSPVSTGLESG